MDGMTGDLQAKYQKLAAEYAKVRAQVNVLKNAMVEEQVTTSDLRNTLREREQSLRRTEQEMDSLKFRNQQLTCRVVVLQEELELQSKPKKGKKAPVEVHEPPSGVLDEELHKKITENAQLVSQLHDKEEEHQQQIQELNFQLERLQHDYRIEREQHLKTIAKLESELASALSAAKTAPATGRSQDNRLETLQQSNVKLTAHVQELSAQRIELNAQLESARSFISTHLPFVDSSDSELNELNVPRLDRSRTLRSTKLVSSAKKHVIELTQTLADFHSACHDRTQAIHTVLSPFTVKLLAYLQEGSRKTRALEEGYIMFERGLEVETSLDVLPTLHALSRPLQSYSAYLQKLQPYQNLSLTEENVLNGASEEHALASKAVADGLANFASQFIKLSNYVKLISGQNQRTSQHPISSQQRFLQELTSSLKSIHLASQDLLNAYSLKLALEGGEATVSQEGDKVLGSLTAIVSASGKLADCIAEGVDNLNQPSTVSRQIHPVITAFRRRASNYLNMIDQEESPSVPYDEALKVCSRAEACALRCLTLTQQLETLQTQKSILEQKAEEWRQLYELQQLKLNESQIEITPAKPKGDDNGGPTVSNNLLGKLSSPFSMPAEVEQRELRITEYFRKRLNDLMSQSQAAESKAATLLSECAVLQARLEAAVQSQNTAEDRANKLADELAATSSGYDEQLAMLSEHLATVTEENVVQKDTIEQLRFEQNHPKSAKKGKKK